MNLNIFLGQEAGRVVLILTRDIACVDTSLIVWKRMRLLWVELQVVVNLTVTRDWRHSLSMFLSGCYRGNLLFLTIRFRNLANWLAQIQNIFALILRRDFAGFSLGFESIGSLGNDCWAHRPLRNLCLKLMRIYSSLNSHNTLGKSQTRHTVWGRLSFDRTDFGLFLVDRSRPEQGKAITLLRDIPEYRRLPPLDLMGEHLRTTRPSIDMAFHRLNTRIPFYAIPRFYSYLRVLTLLSVWVEPWLRVVSGNEVVSLKCMGTRALRSLKWSVRWLALLSESLLSEL